MIENSIKNSVRELKKNLTEIARVCEWAVLMGYKNPKRFSDKFLRHFGVRPQKIMELIRLESIIRDLRAEENHSNLRIARMHSLPDEKTLYNFINYHTGYSPTGLKRMSENDIQEIVNELRSKIMDQYYVGKLWSANHSNGW